ncbi:contactin-3-like [Sinocyclocheilus anshuiensis]|uniref:contactin-3-like n=1 Tax=Sinocyclocheilus anshuiensis TaxID=1608454 RepID=UPI0007B80A3E|nr:PREDICTED: contactin-3-like [Sinocyclocheilus anshuiensis]
MASLVVLECHLWLTLTEMKDADKIPFLDAPVSPKGLFGPAVEGFAVRFTEAQKSWSLNGTLINLSTDSRRRLSGGNLVIRSLDRAQDGGIYQCIAFNPQGAILSRRASLQFAYLHLKTQTRSAVSVREGQGVVLLCGTPSYAGDLSFAWVFNEYPYFVQQDNRRFVSQETGNLYIAKVEPSDVGNYTCVVVNRITKGKVLSSPTPLVLRTDGVMGEYEPKIEVNFSDMVPAAKGSVVTLECFALGNPVPEITWRRANGVPFPSKVKMKNSNVVLEIPSFQQEDAGGYECVAENKMGKNTVQGRLSFHAKPQWVQTMRDNALSIEERLFWECKANGKPKPSYSWLKNGELLAAEDRIQIENGALTISSVNLSDAGMYQCVAENKHGIIYFGAELVVLASPPDFSRSPLRALLKAKTGSTVTMECRPQAFPTAISMWRKGIELVQSTDRITLLPDGTLRITNVTKMDGGNYACLARNQFGAASTTGKLLVTDPTQITQGPVDMEIIVGESIVLPCQISCDPALDVSFSWAFNGQLLNKLDQHYEHVGGSTSGDLMIRNIQLKHAGKYVCVVDTDVESLSAVAILIVKGPPGAPDGVTVEEITDSTAQLSWRPGQDNGSPITSYIIQAKTAFTVGWQAVNTVPEVIDGNTLTATVVDLNAWVEYEFRVLARNSVGVGEPSPTSLKTRTEDAEAGKMGKHKDLSKLDKGQIVVYWEDDTKPETMGKVRVSANQNKVNISGLREYTQYFLTVSVFNTAGTGPLSPTINVTTKKSPPGQPPLNVEWNLIGSKLTVHWEPVISLEMESDVTGYQVSYRRNRHKEINTITTNLTSVELTLPADDDYIIQIRALSDGGEGMPTEPINIHKLSMSVRGSRAWRPNTIPVSLLSIIVLSTLRLALC